MSAPRQITEQITEQIAEQITEPAHANPFDAP